VTVTTRLRHDLGRAAVLLAGALLLTACVGGGASPAPTPSAPGAAGPSGAQSGCTATVTTDDEAARVLAVAVAGSTVCATGDGLRDADLVVQGSGTNDRPVVLAGEGATPVRSITVTADHVVVQGFAAVGGQGIALSGTGLTVRGNRVEKADLDGISCEDICDDAVVEDNTVVGTDGSGILVMGDRIMVRRNSVSGSVRRKASDADGIRFFGRDVQIRENTVFDIKADGYPPGTEPHTDCFQTFDDNRPPTVGAVLADNVCRNVDAQCLIATADEAGDRGQVGRSHGIRFTGNQCEVEGSQAVFTRWFPDVTVQGNTFSGPGLASAAVFTESSTNGQFRGNTVPDGVRPFDVDGSSRQGFSSDRPD
jgi:parallel beta helix pectate lyase-like protein